MRNPAGVLYAGIMAIIVSYITWVVAQDVLVALFKGFAGLIIGGISLYSVVGLFQYGQRAQRARTNTTFLVAVILLFAYIYFNFLI